MEYAADTCVKFVKLVDGPTAVDVPQNAVIQHEFISHVERRTIPRIVIGTISVMQARQSVASRNVIDLMTHQTHNDVINSQSTSTISVMQAGQSVASRNVIDLMTHQTHNDVINSQSTCTDCSTSEAVAANY